MMASNRCSAYVDFRSAQNVVFHIVVYLSSPLYIDIFLHFIHQYLSSPLNIHIFPHLLYIYIILLFYTYISFFNFIPPFQFTVMEKVQVLVYPKVFSDSYYIIIASILEIIYIQCSIPVFTIKSLVMYSLSMFSIWCLQFKLLL